MILLCDTCSVLMLIRIAPEMFCNPKYECVTIKAVYDELFQTPKFKTKYPWLIRLEPKIKTLDITVSEKNLIEKNKKLINNHVESPGVINNITGESFNLSKADKTVIAHAVCLNKAVSSVDRDLCAYLDQQFKISALEPLFVINLWLQKGLIIWNDNKQAVLENWINCGEARQSQENINKFEELTGREYPGI